MKNPRMRTPLASAALMLTLGLLPGAFAQTAPTLPVSAQTAEAASVTSTVTLPFSAPAQAERLVLAHDLPQGARFVPGSVTLDGVSVADPRVGPSGRLYFELPARTSGVLQYQLTSGSAPVTLAPPALLALYPRDRREVLAGTLDLRDYAAAVAQPGLTENAGAVKTPLAGTVYRDRNQVSVTVRGALGTELALSVNGQPVPASLLGRRVTDETLGVETRDYLAVPLRVGENVLSAGGDEVRVYLAGRTERIVAEGLQLQADGSTPVRVRLRALDANGLSTAQPFLTLRSSLEPLTPDANPQEAGYQVRLTDGEGLLELRPQTVPASLSLEFALDTQVQRQVLAITPDPARVALGHVSVTLGLSPLQFGQATGAAYMETMLGQGKLYAAASSEGLPAQENPTQRFPVYGDASTETVALSGADPVAFRYEHPDYWVHYRQATVPVDVFSVGSYTALAGSTRGDTRVSGYAALVPREQVDEILTPDGTRLYRLRVTPVAPDSESIEVVTREPGSGKELARTELRRLVDYTLDPTTGVLTLSRPLTRVDEAFNDVTLEVRYRAAQPLSNRALSWGVQVQRDAGPWSLAAATVQLDGTYSSGVRARYATDTTRASALVAYSGALQVSADAQTKLPFGVASASVRYQQAGYGGLGAFDEGLRAQGSVQTRLSDRWAGVVEGAYVDTPEEKYSTVSAVARTTQGPFSVGGGVRAGTGDKAGAGIVGELGYRGQPLNVDLTHYQALTGSGTTSTLNASYTLTPNVSLTARQDIEWGKTSRGNIGLSGRFGATNLSVQYELPTVSGEGNRARFGVDTTLPLGPRFSIGLAAAHLHDLKGGPNESSFSPTLRYQDTQTSAALGTDFSVRAGVLKTVVRGGVTTSLNDRFTLTADGTAEFGVTPGARLALGSAYRSGQWNALGYLRYQDGSLAGGRPELTAEGQVEYHQATFSLRGGVAARRLLDDPDSFAWQPSVAGTAYVTDWLGLGAGARALIQPATNSTQFGFGVEASLRTLPGLWTTLGYNLSGFDGLGTIYTRPGVYLRLDLILDETTGARK
ncbi:hypothetical protein [Deinococcus hohokamensis]|uniref:Uncharacterized protein n=1 Tax=Deinococcus hohokamensis TaxID=309883 RepID=A0ABV9I5L8_9DEIO